jgi:hypothetical protein
MGKQVMKCIQQSQMWVILNLILNGGLVEWKSKWWNLTYLFRKIKENRRS